MDAANRQKVYVECSQPNASGYRIEVIPNAGCGLAGGGIGALFRVQHQHPTNGNWISQGTYRYTNMCIDRPSGASGTKMSPDDSGFFCKDGCMYQEFGDTEVCGTDVSTGEEVCAGGYSQHANGETCTPGPGGPLPPTDDDPPPPDDPPCIIVNGFTICNGPDGVCASDGSNPEACANHPPPDDAGCSGPTCVTTGNPPGPPPTVPPGEEPPPPCVEGHANQGGVSGGYRVDCDDPPPNPCIENPSLPQCDDDDDDPPSFCEQNPSHQQCRSFCENNPDNPACGICEDMPNLPQCTNDDDEFCQDNPSHPSCDGAGFCDENPDHASCEGGDFCESNPSNPLCEWCLENPDEEICGGDSGDPDFCAENPRDPACTHCIIHPDDPICDDVGDTCESNPELPECNQNEASGGETCEQPPSCQGDFIACATLNQQWRTRCAVEAITDGAEGVGDQFDIEDVDPQTMFGQIPLDTTGVNTSGFLGGGACPSFPSVSVMGVSIDFPEQFCPLLAGLGHLVVIFSLVAAARIIGGP